MRFSYCMVPAGPMADLDEAMLAADRLGFDTLTTNDEIWEYDPYVLLGSAAQMTKRIRLGFDVTHILLRHPALIAQSLGTLDRRSNGRVEAAISIGSIDMLELFEVERDRPAARLREAHTIIRQLLDTGESTFAGEYYRTSGVTTTARPVQEHLPVYLGGMKGPLAFRLAGKVADGLHEAGAYGFDALQYAANEFRSGAEAAGKDWRTMDLAAWIGGVVSEDGEAAREAAKIMTAFYMPANPPELLERHGIDPADMKPINDLLSKGDVAGAVRALPDEVASGLTIAGTPEECAEQLQETFVKAGFNHLLFAFMDQPMIKTLTGADPGPIPRITEQLELIARRIMPRLT